jgi:bifunctional non-homologous end joining protein LigD
MLLQSASLPLKGDYAYEVKWDGFRALVSLHGSLSVRSRNGWDMTHLVPELAEIPGDLVLDGELVALGEDQRPDFPQLCARMLNNRRGIAITFVAFDLLGQDGEDLTRQPYHARRARLERLALHGSAWTTTESFDDGEGLWRAVCQHGMEGIVAKKRSGHYRPGRRGWLKIKNRDYWRYPLEVEAAKQFHKLRT